MIRFLSFVFLVICGLPARLLGCAACFGQSDSPMAHGLNAGMLVLLVFVVGAWALFGSFFVFLVRRANRVNDAVPGDQSDPQHN